MNGSMEEPQRKQVRMRRPHAPMHVYSVLTCRAELNPTWHALPKALLFFLWIFQWRVAFWHAHA